MEELYQNCDRRQVLEREDSTMHISHYEGGVIEEDRRLPMFGWTVEALNMLVLPMVKDKYVQVITTFVNHDFFIYSV